MLSTQLEKGWRVVWEAQTFELAYNYKVCRGGLRHVVLWVVAAGGDT